MNTSKTRLNLGSGKDYKSQGFLNIDIRDNVGADVVADIREIDFPDESFTEIFAKDVLDMISYADAKRLLHKCFRWMKPNSSLSIHLPNLLFLSELFILNDTTRTHEALRWLYGTDGAVDERARRERYGPEIFKKWAYTPKSLTELVEGVGFTVIHRMKTCNGFGFLTVVAKR